MTRFAIFVPLLAASPSLAHHEEAKAGGTGGLIVIAAILGAGLLVRPILVRVRAR